MCEGRKLQTTDDKEIKVGPIADKTDSDFQSLQGPHHLNGRRLRS